MLQLKNLVQDVPNQFRKQNITYFLEAMQEQEKELLDVFDELKSVKDINTAVGQQLDRIGEIVGLSRDEALYSIRDSELDLEDDEKYRILLKAKIARNNNVLNVDCFVRTLKELVGDEYVIFDEFNATVYIVIDEIAQEWLTEEVLKNILPKPVGVRIEIAYKVATSLPVYLGLAMTSIKTNHNLGGIQL